MATRKQISQIQRDAKRAFVAQQRKFEKAMGYKPERLSRKKYQAWIDGFVRTVMARRGDDDPR